MKLLTELHNKNEHQKQVNIARTLINSGELSKIHHAVSESNDSTMSDTHFKKLFPNVK